MLDSKLQSSVSEDLPYSKYILRCPKDLIVIVVCYFQIVLSLLLFARYVQCCSVSTEQKQKLNLKDAGFQDIFSSAATEVRLTLYSELRTEML